MPGESSRANGAKGGRPKGSGKTKGAPDGAAASRPKTPRTPRKQKDSPALTAAIQAYTQLELARNAGDTARMQQALSALGAALKSAPKPEAAPRITFPHIAHAKKRAFLVAYAECATVTEAAQIAGIDRKSHTNWMKADDEYREAFEVAREAAGDRLEKEAWRRAVEGWEEPVFHQGRQVSTVRKFDSTLLIFLLKGNRPEKFRERYEHSGPNGAPLPVGGPVLLYMPDNGRNAARA